MGVFTRRKPPKPSKITEERLTRAEQELEEQKRKHEEAIRTKHALEEALAQNHIAQLMYEALSVRRGDH